MISQRPESVAARRFYGDGEADLMEGPRHSPRSLLVLTDRKSRYTVIRSVENRKADTVARAIIQSLQPYRVRTITYDNGSEFAKFAEVCEATHSKAYFRNPYHAWEKPLVENTIGLLREYFPKKTKTALPKTPNFIETSKTNSIEDQEKYCIFNHQTNSLPK